MKRVLLPLLATGFCLLSPLVQAASDYLLQIDGIKGESPDATHPETIEIESFSWGVSNAGSHAGGGGGGAGKVSMQDLHFVIKVNKASPQLMLACATGQHIKKATLMVRKAGGDGRLDEYLVLTFSDILVSSFSQSGSSGGGDSVPTESLALSVRAVQVDYTAADGSVHTGSAARSEEGGGVN